MQHLLQCMATNTLMLVSLSEGTKAGPQVLNLLAYCADRASIRCDATGNTIYKIRYIAALKRTLPTAASPPCATLPCCRLAAEYLSCKGVESAARSLGHTAGAPDLASSHHVVAVVIHHHKLILQGCIEHVSASSSPALVCSHSLVC